MIPKSSGPVAAEIVLMLRRTICPSGTTVLYADLVTTAPCTSISHVAAMSLNIINNIRPRACISKAGAAIKRMDRPMPPKDT